MDGAVHEHSRVLGKDERRRAGRRPTVEDGRCAVQQSTRVRRTRVPRVPARGDGCFGRPLRVAGALERVDGPLQLVAAAPRMELADRKASHYEAGIVSAVEAALLEGSVGKTFEAVVIDLDRDGVAGSVELRDPAVTARCDGPGLALGETVTVRLERADVMQRQVRFALA